MLGVNTFIILITLVLTSCSMSPNKRSTASVTVEGSFCPTASELKHGQILKIMSFNIFKSYEDKRLTKIAELIAFFAPDIIGLQEVYPGKNWKWGDGPNIKSLVKKLKENGLNYYSYNEGQILSLHPISRKIAPSEWSRDGGVYLKAHDKINLALFNVHLTSNPFGPKIIRDGRNNSKYKEALNNPAVTSRMTNLKSVFTKYRRYNQSKVPLFLVGDFNSSSHLDWHVKNPRFSDSPWPDKKSYFPWRESLYIISQGMRDSFRELNPVDRFLGNTWTPGYTYPYGMLLSKDPAKNELAQRDEPKERIDYIYYKSHEKIKLICSQVIGEDFKNAQLVYRDWPSDHRAVISVFRVLD